VSIFPSGAALLTVPVYLFYQTEPSRAIELLSRDQKSFIWFPLRHSRPWLATALSFAIQTLSVLNHTKF
jgi:hypothetical protein